MLKYGQYTKPAIFEGKKVPKVFRSGNHELIKIARLKESLLRTKIVRPDLLNDYILSKKERSLLKNIEDYFWLNSRDR